MFFSSHILSDAEALCSRVAIVAGGRLATMGRLTDMAGYELRGWEVVVTGLTAEAVTRLAGRRHHGDGGLGRPLHAGAARDARPETVVSDLAGSGAALVSVTPLHTTLEEIFVEQVAKTASARKGAL